MAHAASEFESGSSGGRTASAPGRGTLARPSPDRVSGCVEETSGRLFTILREQKGWTYGAYSSLTRPRGTGACRRRGRRSARRSTCSC